MVVLSEYCFFTCVCVVLPDASNYRLRFDSMELARFVLLCTGDSKKGCMIIFHIVRFGLGEAQISLSDEPNKHWVHPCRRMRHPIIVAVGLPCAVVDYSSSHNFLNYVLPGISFWGAVLVP